MRRFQAHRFLVVTGLAGALVLGSCTAQRLNAQQTPPPAPDAQTPAAPTPDSPIQAPDSPAQSLQQELNDQSHPQPATQPKIRRLQSGVGGVATGTSLETDEALFDLMAALNACGYDEDIGRAGPIRLQVRAQMAEIAASNEGARSAQEKICSYIRHHELDTTPRTLAQYISLGLVLTPPPELAPTAPLTDLPPDATQVVGILPLLRSFAAAMQLHPQWVTLRPKYDASITQLSSPLTRSLLETDVYVRQPSARNDVRRFLVVLEPLLAGGEVNARVYGTDYLLVLAPPNTDAPVTHFRDVVRHFYLQYSVEPLIFGYPKAILRLEPLLRDVRESPLPEPYRSDVAALVSECLIRAITARTMDTGIAPYVVPNGRRLDPRVDREQAERAQAMEAVRLARVERDQREGFILTRYFYNLLPLYEHGTESLSDQIGQMVYGMDLEVVAHQARQIHFAPASPSASTGKAAPGTGLQRRGQEANLAQTPENNPLDAAEARLSQGDPLAAIDAAQQSLDANGPDPGRANFILARGYALTGNMKQAQLHFAQTLSLTKDPHTLGWSHVYLGRIFDIQQDRPQAVAEYRAALQLKDALPDTKAAAQKGIEQAYAPPVRRPEPASPDTDETKRDSDSDSPNKADPPSR